MGAEDILFHYGQKLIIFSQDQKSVLVAKRAGEADCNSVYSFIGGKFERTDETLIAGLARVKCEEIGTDVQIAVCQNYTSNKTFRKKDGSVTVIAHHLARYVSGTIQLANEYSEYQWVKVTEFEDFEPKVPGMLETLNELLLIQPVLPEFAFIRI